MTSQTRPSRWLRAVPVQPALRSPEASPCGGEHLALALAPGLQAVFDPCLSEVMPSDLAVSLADLLARLDREAATPTAVSTRVR
ncbi:hypothetical protein [Methylobacterium oryzisoli]|uniref:hypothetical protein n=1 Tax=Methylobacterium oryzisoli TaxID=3385502 RepID=UPI003891F643